MGNPRQRRLRCRNRAFPWLLPICRKELKQTLLRSACRPCGSRIEGSSARGPTKPLHPVPNLPRLGAGGCEPHFSQSARDALRTNEPADSRAWLPEVPNPSVLLVRAGRLELPRPYGQQILSLPRLPFRHARSNCSGPPALERSLPLGLTQDKRSRCAAPAIAAGNS